ncbi:MAG: ThuA domain-containing protein [Opitutaceae bacterium]|nr:ThuA domain-containing protein [Opitutaceae bacterium]
MRTTFAARLLAFAALASLVAPGLAAAEKKVLLIAGAPSHGPGHHEHHAGVRLLEKCLAGQAGLRTTVFNNAWPAEAELAAAAAIVIYGDGGPKHIALQSERLAQLDRVLARGTGLGLLHYATEPTLELGQKEFLRWVGAAFEIHWSVNPHWDATFSNLPNHPITRGVRPFTLRDEWYFHLRFAEDRRGLTPILSAVPDASTMSRPDGHHSGNPAVRAAVARGEPQTVAWAYERADGGRGFGTTGGHYHSNWAQDDFRKLVLNAVLWLAKLEVPRDGFVSTVTPADLAANLDPKPASKAKAADAKKR